eukprot:3726479-Amphidinium_carterae.1
MHGRGFLCRALCLGVLPAAYTNVHAKGSQYSSAVLSCVRHHCVTLSSLRRCNVQHFDGLNIVIEIMLAFIYVSLPHRSHTITWASKPSADATAQRELEPALSSERDLQ